MIRALALLTMIIAAAPPAFGTTINTNDLTVYNAFAAGATIQTFESVAGLTPLGLGSYLNALNSSTAVPLSAQLGGQIAGLHFHSGGATPSNPSANPGTPTAFLQLQSLIAGNAHSVSNVVGSLEINTQQLDLDNFVEVIFTTTLQNRAGVWLNPALGSALFTAFDATGIGLESVIGSAGNFVAVTRATNDIKFVSIVGGPSGFTIDDLTYGLVDSAPREVPEPGLALLLGLGVTGLVVRARRRGRTRSR